ncbi:MAG TPA: hypothetical protein VGH33_08230 [Isosphaeraceae bacterium]
MLVRHIRYRFWRVPRRLDGEEIGPDDYLGLGPFLDLRIAQASRSRWEMRDEAGFRSSVRRRPSEFAAWTRRGAACGLDTIAVISPPATDRKAEGIPTREWVVRMTSVLFVPTAAAHRVENASFARAPGVAAGNASVQDGDVSIGALADPSRRHVADAVASAWAYPASLLLRGDRETLVKYLEARHGRRLRASFGDPAGLSTTRATGER